MSLEPLKVGMLVMVTVSKVNIVGIEVSFLDTFKGSIPLIHLAISPDEDWEKHYSDIMEKEEPLKARIIFISANNSDIRLALRPNIVKLTEYKFKPNLKVGQIIKSATI